MGSTVSKSSKKFSKRNTIRALMLGMENTGKSTILHSLGLGDVTETRVAIGFYNETLDCNEFNIVSWDLGGNKKLRLLLKPYYQNVQALIFVFDCSDRLGVYETKLMLNTELSQQELKDVPLLVLANKQDLGIMNVEEVIEGLGLYGLGERDWYIQETCALTGDGLYKGLEWLKKAVSQKK